MKDHHEKLYDAVAKPNPLNNEKPFVNLLSAYLIDQIKSTAMVFLENED